MPSSRDALAPSLGQEAPRAACFSPPTAHARCFCSLARARACCSLPRAPLSDLHAAQQPLVFSEGAFTLLWSWLNCARAAACTQPPSLVICAAAASRPQRPALWSTPPVSRTLCIMPVHAVSPSAHTTAPQHAPVFINIHNLTTVASGSTLCQWLHARAPRLPVCHKCMEQIRTNKGERCTSVHQFPLECVCVDGTQDGAPARAWVGSGTGRLALHLPVPQTEQIRTKKGERCTSDFTFGVNSSLRECV